MGKKIKVLLAEDELSLGMIIKESLETRDFEVRHCPDGQQAIDSYDDFLPDVVVLDVMMPKMDGFAVAKSIRKKSDSLPIIFLTSRSQTEDVLQGFNSGGNDYVRKPFSMEELIVRIHELLKRQSNHGKNSSIHTIGRYKFDQKSQLLTLDKTEVLLTHREAEVLGMLAKDLNQLVEKSDILKTIWGDDDFFNGRSLDVFITKLRKKLHEDPSVQILNVRGFGYKLLCE
jgi:DNA-binding response OmpR family regulator